MDLRHPQDTVSIKAEIVPFRWPKSALQDSDESRLWDESLPKTQSDLSLAWRTPQRVNVTIGNRRQSCVEYLSKGSLRWQIHVALAE